MADRPLPGYPQPFGSRYVNICTHQGPANYQQGNASDQVTARAVGLSVFDHVSAGPSIIDNANNAAGTYTVRAQLPFGQSSLTSQGSNSVNFQWMYAANGNEVANNANLAAEFARVLYFGDL